MALLSSVSGLAAAGLAIAGSGGGQGSVVYLTERTEMVAEQGGVLRTRATGRLVSNLGWTGEAWGEIRGTTWEASWTDRGRGWERDGRVSPGSVVLAVMGEGAVADKLAVWYGGGFWSGRAGWSALDVMGVPAQSGAGIGMCWEKELSAAEIEAERGTWGGWPSADWVSEGVLRTVVEPVADGYAMVSRSVRFEETVAAERGSERRAVTIWVEGRVERVSGRVVEWSGRLESRGRLGLRRMVESRGWLASARG